MFRGLMFGLIALMTIVSCKKNGSKEETVKEETVYSDDGRMYDDRYYNDQNYYRGRYGENYGYGNCSYSYCPPQNVGQYNQMPPAMNYCQPYGNNYLDMPNNNGNPWAGYGYVFQQTGCVYYNGYYYSAMQMYYYLLSMWQNQCGGGSNYYDPWAFLHWCQNSYPNMYMYGSNGYYPYWNIFGSMYGSGGSYGVGGGFQYTSRDGRTRISLGGGYSGW